MAIIDQAAVAGVITGDIVNSNSLSAENHKICLDQIEHTISRLADVFDVQGDVFRGDEFQVFVPNPKQALRCAVLLRLALMMCIKNVDARVSIGIGGYKDLSDSLRKTVKGEAFELSGKALNTMKNERLTVTVAATRHEAVASTTGLLVQYLDFMITDLSQRQAEALFSRVLFTGLTQEALSKETGIARRSLASRLQRSNAALILETLDVLENTLTRSVT